MHSLMIKETPHAVVDLRKDETQVPTACGKLLTRICLVLALASAISWKCQRMHKRISEVNIVESREGEHLFLHRFRRGTDSFIKYYNNTPPCHPSLTPPYMYTNINTKEYDSSHLRLRAQRQLNLAQYFYLFDPKTIVSKHEIWDRQHQHTHQLEFLRDGHKVKTLSAPSSEIGGERQQQLSTALGEVQLKQPMVHQEPSPEVSSSSTVLLADPMGAYDKDQNNEIQLHQGSEPAGKQIDSTQLDVLQQLGTTESLSETNAPLQLSLPNILDEDHTHQESEVRTNHSRNQNIQLNPEEAFKLKTAQLPMQQDDSPSRTIPQNDISRTEKLVNKISKPLIPSSFRYLADFPSQLESGDIPVVRRPSENRLRLNIPTVNFVILTRCISASCV
jgi:hypothetical protein